VPTGRRSRLHQRVGEWLEHTYGAQVAAIAGPLAWHFEEAGDDRRAIRYLILTAQNAAGRFAFADAIRVLEHARTLARHLPAHTGLDVEIELLQRIGDAQSALSTAEPNLQALAWDIAARVAMAEEDWKAAEEHSGKGLAVLQKFAIPATAWMLHATRSSLYRHVKNHTAAETHRARAEAIILALANSVAPDDPLRHTFLAARPVRRMLRVEAGSKGGRQRWVPTGVDLKPGRS
jgi:hypothetical protein